MDELELKNENLGHFHSPTSFLFLFNLEHSASHDFLGGFSLVFGVYCSYLFFGGLAIINSFMIESQSDFLVKLNIGRAVLYMLSFCFILLSIYCGKKYRNLSYFSLVITHCLFYLSFAELIYSIVIGETKNDLVSDIFEALLLEVVSLYLMWTLYSVTVHIIKEQKYIIFAGRREPGFLKDEYKELRSKADYNIVV